MSKDWEKYIKKSPHKDKLIETIGCILEGETSSLNVLKLIGYDDLYRVKVGKYRIIFQKYNGKNIVIKVKERGGIYKSI